MNENHDRKRRRRLIFSLLALATFSFPALVVWRDLNRWDEFLPEPGTVVRIRPEGPFPDFVTVEYPDSSGQTHQVEISTNYATARKVGDTVDIVYHPDAPAGGMTRIQRRDEGWSFSPYVLLGSLAASTFCLYFAFPEYLTLRRRRNQ